MHETTIPYLCPKIKSDAEGIWELSPKHGVAGASGHIAKRGKSEKNPGSPHRTLLYRQNFSRRERESRLGDNVLSRCREFSLNHPPLHLTLPDAPSKRT